MSNFYQGYEHDFAGEDDNSSPNEDDWYLSEFDELVYHMRYVSDRRDNEIEGVTLNGQPINKEDI